MSRRNAFIIITIFALLILGGGVWYAYQKGYLRPSADVVATSVDYASQTQLKQGDYFHTELQNGKIQLQISPQ